MKELNRTKRLIIATVLFVIIILIGFLTFKSPKFEYAISPDLMVEELNKPNNLMTPNEAIEIIDNDNSFSVFVDLRNPIEFNNGFLGEAINIPVSDILLDESIEFFHQMVSDSIIVILYSNNQLEANGPWMLLKQLGFNNMKVLMGGYNFLSEKKVEQYTTPVTHEYREEEPILNYAAFMAKASGVDKSSQKPEKKPVLVQPVKRKKKTVSAGGC